ncbi:hypothetical protein HOY80DRAFT_1043879 [Tuber brumale]|nr:hypothetical protein HOY80DRAFT_1043879 [Tuber brumale]
MKNYFAHESDVVNDVQQDNGPSPPYKSPQSSALEVSRSGICVQANYDSRHPSQIPEMNAGTSPPSSLCLYHRFCSPTIKGLVAPCPPTLLLKAQTNSAFDSEESVKRRRVAKGSAVKDTNSNDGDSDGDISPPLSMMTEEPRGAARHFQLNGHHTNLRENSSSLASSLEFVRPSQSHHIGRLITVGRDMSKGKQNELNEIQSTFIELKRHRN